VSELTEDERRARLCERAGCDCSEESKPTPDEIIEWVRQHHYEVAEKICERCVMPWPCVTMRLADALWTARTELYLAQSDLVRADSVAGSKFCARCAEKLQPN